MATDPQFTRPAWWQRATGSNTPNRRPTRFKRDKRSAVTVELAIVGPIFLTFLFVLFEFAYGQFIQSVLESTLQITAYQIQTNQVVTNANGNYSIDSTPNGASFIDNSLCPNAVAGLLSCNNLFIRIEQFETSCSDFYDATSGALPISGGVLELGDYVNDTSINAANSGNVGPINCENTAASGGGNGFCNAGPSEYIIMSAVYTAPTFLYALIPGAGYTYGGRYVHAAFATSAFYTEGFSAPTSPVLPC